MLRDAIDYDAYYDASLGWSAHTHTSVIEVWSHEVKDELEQRMLHGKVDSTAGSLGDTYYASWIPLPSTVYLFLHAPLL